MTLPYHFQKQGINQISLFGGRVLLADEMGLGKSLQSLGWGMRRRISPILVICPASLKWNWAAEALSHFNLHANVLEGRSPPSVRNMHKARLTIINQDIIKDWKDYLIRLKPKLVILDEAHGFKSRDTQRTKVATAICRKAPYVIALTGTPIVNRPIDLYPILKILRPDIWPSYVNFGIEFCNGTRDFWGWKFRGASNLDKLHNELNEHVMIRRLKSEVMHELPKQRQHVVPVPLYNPKEYEALTNQFAKWLHKSGSKLNVPSNQVQRLAWWNKIRQAVARHKMKAVVEWIDNTLESTDSKLVVFAWHRETINRLHKRFPDSVVINGAVIGSKREKAVKEFQSRKRTRILFGNLKAVGVGLNLTAANKVAIVEFGWTPGDHSQAAARIDRIGQNQITDCYFLMGVNTIEDTLVNIIVKKQSIADVAIDGKEIRKLQIMELLEQQIKKGHYNGRKANR